MGSGRPSGHAERRLNLERILWRYRAGVAVLAVGQAAIQSGDHVLANWAIVGVLVTSVLVAGVALARWPTPATARRVGVASMAIDTCVIAALLANNVSDPVDSIYLVTILGTLEAAMRWRLVGGTVASALGGCAAAGWTWVVAERNAEHFQLSYATMRLGILFVVGVFVGFIIERLNDERRMLQLTLDVSRDLIATSDEHGIVLSVNSACRDLLGYEPEEIVGRSYRDFIHDADDIVAHESVADRLQPGGPTVLLEARFRCADGRFRWLEMNVTSVPHERLVYAVGRDVTERREAAQRLAESEQRFRSLFDHSADAVFALDLTGRCTAANPATEELTGFRHAELAERGLVTLIEPADRPRTLAAFEHAARGWAQSFDTTLRTADGRRRDLHVTNLPIVVDAVVVGVYGVAKDVTERRRLERQLARQARRDALTDLPNRFALEEMLAGTGDTELPVGTGLLFVDLDRFKVVNDSLGHRSGDVLIVAVAERLQSCLRNGDVLARWAGDEFCIVLPEAGDEAAATAVADRVLAALEQPFELAGRQVRITASIGVALASGEGEGDHLLQHADLAMYEAKRAGRARISVFEPGIDQRVRSRLDLEVELRRAVHTGRLSLAYQPIVEVANGRIAGLEALVRWPQDDGTLLPPDDFIPLAEETGLVRPLTRWVLGEACRQLAAWDADGPGLAPLAVSVNISAVDLADVGLVDEVAAALRAAGLPASRLVLEVTESMLVRDPEAVGTLGCLRRLGVALAVDDFGTGFSSLSQLHHLPVSSFKLDRAFLEGVGPRTRGASLIASLVGLGATIGLPVVAEGVERGEQLAALGEAGCPLAQGDLFAAAQGAAEAEALLREGRVPLPEAVVPLG